MSEHIYNHTPGPWRISTPNGPSMGWQVGPVWIGRNAGTPQGLADAKLVSAAPKLLIALVEMLYFMEEGDWRTDTPPDDLAREAIKEATGD